MGQEEIRPFPRAFHRFPRAFLEDSAWSRSARGPARRGSFNCDIADEAAQLQMMEGLLATSLFGDVMKTEGDPADRVARIVKRLEEEIKAKMKLLPEKIKQKEKLSKITTAIEEAKANGDQEEMDRLEFDLWKDNLPMSEIPIGDRRGELLLRGNAHNVSGPTCLHK